MKKLTAHILLISVFISLASNLFVNQTFASEFALTQVRIDRHKTSSSTGGQVCATTPNVDNGTENNVQIIFPTGFTVNTTASNWTVNTSNIPQDSTAWPGITTATAVSGQIVTFPSSNLTTDTKYCFNFALLNTLTTSSSTGNYEGTLRTRATNTVVDSQNFGLSVNNNDQITVTATVPADPDDFEAELELTSPVNATFKQDTVLSFTFTYGSNLSYSSTITPQIEWDLGTITGDITPTVDVLSYVVGSASNAYGGAAPVIDTVNRTISWPINSFPANTTGETVTFQLRTTANYTGSSTVDFSVNGRVLGPGTQTADSTVDMVYKYLDTSSGSSGPSGGTSPYTDGRSDGKTDGKSSSPIGSLAIKEVKVRTISQTDASVFVSTNKDSKISVSYGTNPNNLNKITSSDTPSTQHLLSMTGLEPNTKYYFKITAQSLENEKINSDLFTLTTASTEKQASIPFSSIIIISKNVILYDSSHGSTTNGIPTVMIPLNTPYTLKFKSDNEEQIKNLSIISRTKNFLGIDNIANADQSYVSNGVIEITPGNFVSTLNSERTASERELFVRIEEYNGNVYEQVIASTRIVPPFQVVEKGNKKPIENAKLAFYAYNERLKVYEFISSNIIQIKNPDFSNPQGIVFIVLPNGKYKAEVEALGYESKMVEFTIGSVSTDGYPTVELEKMPFSLLTLYQYYTNIIQDISKFADEQLQNISGSLRFFDLITGTALLIFILLLLISASHFFVIPFAMLPFVAFYALKGLGGKKHEHIIQGIVFDSVTQEAVNNAVVYISETGGKVVSHTKTNSAGEFFATAPTSNVKITVSHKSYRNYSRVFSESQTEKRISIPIFALEKKHYMTFEGMLWYTRYIFSSLFEALIFITLLLETLLIPRFGIFKTIPFIAISAISLLLWASLHKQKKLIARDY